MRDVGDRVGVPVGAPGGGQFLRNLMSGVASMVDRACGPSPTIIATVRRGVDGAFPAVQLDAPPREIAEVCERLPAWLTPA